MKLLMCICLLISLFLAPQTAAQAEAAIPTPEVGDIVILGSYEQDNVLDNGTEPLEWIVLEVQDGKAWLLSKYCIEQVIFYPQRVSMYWGASDLRKWMNGEFFEQTFTPAEQEAILTTTVKNDNPHRVKGAGDDTEDKIYLLSKDEVLHFFPEMADRVAYPTEYAKTKGITLSEETGSCRWWTRTPGARKMDICGMRLDGRISEYGMQDVDWPTNTMRPVMWVRTSDDAQPLTEAAAEEPAAEAETAEAAAEETEAIEETEAAAEEAVAEAAEVTAEEAGEPFQPIYALREDAPALTAYGLLPEGSDPSYYLVQDPEGDEWTYIDDKMFINIRRFRDVVERDRDLIWYETEIKVAPGVKFVTQHANPEQIGRRFMWAQDLAKQLNSVLAISDDFYGFRVYAKRKPGVIIQNGVILADDTLKKPHYTLPTYDVIAYYPDGSMKTYLAGAIGAEELLAQGATDTWCFGPVLLSEGQIGQQVLDNDFEYINPRMTLGMIEPNHYLIMTVEGRHKDSDGVGLKWVAERMRDLGCTEALNLDGGNSIKLVFMGEILNSQRHYNEKNDRTVTSLITLGTFPLDTLQPAEE